VPKAKVTATYACGNDTWRSLDAFTSHGNRMPLNWHTSTYLVAKTRGLPAGPLTSHELPDCLARHAEATLGERLRAHRLAAGLTLKALGRRARLPWQWLSGYEGGRFTPRWRNLHKLVGVLGLGLVDVTANGRPCAEGSTGCRWSGGVAVAATSRPAIVLRRSLGGWLVLAQAALP
jgi:hypothetical protein